MRLSCPSTPGHGWMGPFLPHSLPTPTAPSLAPLSHLPFSPLQKDMPLPLPAILPCCLLSPRLPTPTPSGEGRCYWCFFMSGPSSICLCCVSSFWSLLQSLSGPQGLGLSANYPVPTQPTLAIALPKGGWRRLNPAIFQQGAN